MVTRMLRALVRRAGEGDTEALEQLAALETLASRAVPYAAQLAHDQAGYSWGQLGDVLGLSRQSVQERACRVAIPPQLVPR